MTCQNDDDNHNMFKVGVWTQTKEGQGKEGGRKRHYGWCMPSVNLKNFLLVNELCAWGQGYFLFPYALTCILITNTSKDFIHANFHCKYC